MIWKFIVIMSCSFFLLACTESRGGNYEIINDDVYYFYVFAGETYYIELKNADEKSFRDLGLACGYGKDKNTVYYARNDSVVVIEGADPDTFEFIDCLYSKDAENVYFEKYRLPDSDPKSFLVLSNSYYSYSKDKNNVYYLWNLVEEADASTIKVFDENYMRYAKDCANVYFEGKVLQEADPKSFAVIKPYSSYSKDDKHVYYKEEFLYWIDAPSFELLDYRYSKDKDHVYFYNGVIEGADLETFKVISDVDAEDKDNIYYRGRKVEEVDANS